MRNKLNINLFKNILNILIMEQGYLKIILGCMYAGKTSKLVNIYKMMKFSNITTLVINYAEDKRYDNTKLSTHDKTMIPCIQTLKLMELINNKEISEKVIIINEGQFFPDLLKFVKNSNDCNLYSKNLIPLKSKYADKDNKKICNADYLVISNRYNDWDLIYLDQIYKISKKIDKKLILVKIKPHFNTYGTLTIMKRIYFLNSKRFEIFDHVIIVVLYLISYLIIQYLYNLLA